MSDDEKKPVCEKIEDIVDETIYKVQNAIYGERKNIGKDIPATIEDPNGFRKVNKFATRRNIMRKIIKNPIILLIGVGLIIVATILIVIF